ncbi:MAG: TatD family hydrolase [bacterium]
MLVDTHAHLWFEDFSQDLADVLVRAKSAGVEKMIVPGTDLESSKKAIELASKYPGIIYAAAGVHPEELLNHKSSDLSFAALQTALRSELGTQVVAIGEIGTDASTEELKTHMGEQQLLFKTQCEVALELDLPVIIHTRNSFTETWEVLKSLKKMPRGQFHCFSLDEDALRLVLESGFYVSFCGNITWSKRVARMVRLVLDERLLLETDSPFMIPRIAKIPNSGPESSEPENNRNEPANVKLLAEIIAELRGQKLAEIEEMTTANVKTLFQL